MYGRQVHPQLKALGKGFSGLQRVRVVGVRTLRYGQEAIRHKRTTSRATPLPTSEVVIIRLVGFPAGVNDAYPFECQGADGAVMRFSSLTLTAIN